MRMQEALRTTHAAARDVEQPVAVPSQTTTSRPDDTGKLGLANAVLGNYDGDCLCVGVIDFTQVGVFSSLREVCPN